MGKEPQPSSMPALDPTPIPAEQQASDSPSAGFLEKLAIRLFGSRAKNRAKGQYEPAPIEVTPAGALMQHIQNMRSETPLLSLDTSTSIVVKLSGAPAATQPDVLVTVRDIQPYSPSVSRTFRNTFNGTTEVTACAAPSSGTREVDVITICNRDSSSVSAYVAVAVSAARTYLCESLVIPSKVTLVITRQGTTMVPAAASPFLDSEGEPADVTYNTTADGTSSYPARRDHVHQLSADALLATQVFGR
jgi:hypothetical protein